VTLCKQIQTSSLIKTLNSQIIRGIDPAAERKVYDGKDLSKSQVLSWERKAEGVNKDEIGDC